MLTPAEELLAAVKEHATADVYFTFNPKHHASSAVYSAFLRARGGKA